MINMMDVMHIVTYSRGAMARHYLVLWNLLSLNGHITYLLALTA